jgi:DnaJ-class molecular chaperone
MGQEEGAQVSKPDKIMKKCPTCKGKKTLPDNIAKELVHPPKPGQKIKCPTCEGKGFVVRPPKN